MPKFQKGDLVRIELVEHIDDPKKFAIMGTFKGTKNQCILARVGEGKDDTRDEEVIKLTAELVVKEIQSLYATMAYNRSRRK